MTSKYFERIDSKYAVVLTNFGNTVYEGTDLSIATRRAESVGFEVTLVMRVGEELDMKFYSPIGGWH